MKIKIFKLDTWQTRLVRSNSFRPRWKKLFQSNVSIHCEISGRVRFFGRMKVRRRGNVKGGKGRFLERYKPSIFALFLAIMPAEFAIRLCEQCIGPVDTTAAWKSERRHPHLTKAYMNEKSTKAQTSHPLFHNTTRATTSNPQTVNISTPTPLPASHHQKKRAESSNNMEISH